MANPRPLNARAERQRFGKGAIVNSTVSAPWRRYLLADDEIVWSGEPEIPERERLQRLRITRFLVFGRPIFALFFVIS
jgi:hypothetical protein